MSVMTDRPVATTYDIVCQVGAGCRQKPSLGSGADKCVNWILEELQRITLELPELKYRQVWWRMKSGRPWKIAGFHWDDWQKACSRVSQQFDVKFQTPPKHKSKSHRGERRNRGGRAWTPRLRAA